MVDKIKEYNDNANNNNNNDRIEKHNLRFLQSPHCDANCLQQVSQMARVQQHVQPSHGLTVWTSIERTVSNMYLKWPRRNGVYNPCVA